LGCGGGGCGCYGRVWGQGGEMTQALYAHMNNKKMKNKKIKTKWNILKTKKNVNQGNSPY
jgi:hypothetical protein